MIDPIVIKAVLEQFLRIVLVFVCVVTRTKLDQEAGVEKANLTEMPCVWGGLLACRDKL